MYTLLRAVASNLEHVVDELLDADRIRVPEVSAGRLRCANPALLVGVDLCQWPH